MSTGPKILALLKGERRSGDGWQALCPAHDDRAPSLTITESPDGKTLLHCHAGCTPESICSAVGLKLSDLFPEKAGPRRIAATYDYQDAGGKLLFQVVRFDHKDFRQRRPDKAALDGWAWNTRGVQRVLFRLPEIVRDVKRGFPVFVCEGEKDVLKMVEKGFSATCNPGGAGKWQDSYSETLRGADCVVIPDRDEAGRKHAQLVAGKLHGVAKRVRVVELPDVNGRPVKDAFDFFAAGGDAGQVAELVDSAPEWKQCDTENQEDIGARPIGTLAGPKQDDEGELLTRRYLCRGAGLLLVGQSGQGKSSLALQMCVQWSLGRDCFGIRPTRPLNVLLVQAENDEGDLFEMFAGIAAGLQLSEEDRKSSGERILFHCEDARAGDDFLRLTVEPLVQRHRPDLLVIDPALAYVGGDTKDAECVGQFLRRGLNPILHANNCAALIVHHTTKQKADGPQTTHDFLYAGAGSIEFTNWARAVLALETRGDGCYRLHAPKRGARVGWADADGQPVFDRFIRHSRKPGEICWLPMEDSEVESAARGGKSKSDLLAHVPVEGSIPQTVLLEKANAAGIGKNKSRAFLDELVDDRTLHVWLVPRPGTNPAKSISRHRQPEPESKP